MQAHSGATRRLRVGPKAGPGAAVRLEAGSCREGFACIFWVRAVLLHQACADGSVFFAVSCAQGGSAGIHLACATYFGPFLPRSNLHRSILDRFLQQYANCRVPVPRQAGDWCAICQRLVNHRSMNSLGKCRSMAGWHGFWTRTACMGAAWQLRCGSRLRAQSPPHWWDSHAERAGTVYC